MGLFHQYVVVDLWNNAWANFLTPSVFTLAAVVVSHFRHKAHRNKQHAELLEKIGGGK